MSYDPKDYDPEELEIEDTNGCTCCLSSIYVRISGDDLLELIKIAGVSEELIKQTKQRFENVSDENYSRLHREQELIWQEHKNIGTK